MQSYCNLTCILYKHEHRVLQMYANAHYKNLTFYEANCHIYSFREVNTNILSRR